MKDVLCIYYSRTGNTKKAMEEIAGELGAEVVELRDDTDRTGWRGWLRCGLDAMRKTSCPLQPFETERPLDQYRLVILGTPVWAGRCSSVMRAFLKENGQKLKNVAYVIRWICICPAAGGLPCRCGWGPWDMSSGKWSFCGRCGRHWLPARFRRRFQIAGEVRWNAGKTKGDRSAV